MCVYHNYIKEGKKNEDKFETGKKKYVNKKGRRIRKVTKANCQPIHLI